MPTYEYRCTRCENTFEARQTFTEPALEKCPLESASNGESGLCGGAVKKIFGNVGIAFKGSGFYKTDSRSNSGMEKTGSSGESSPSSDSSSSSSSSDSSSSSSDTKSSGSTANTSDTSSTKKSESTSSGGSTPAKVPSPGSKKD